MLCPNCLRLTEPSRSIEDQVRKTCADLVHDAVVVGFALPAPGLVVESVQADLDDAGRFQLAEQIVEKLSPFNERLYMHEVSMLCEPGD
jgi:hypothetical protein